MKTATTMLLLAAVIAGCGSSGDEEASLDANTSATQTQQAPATPRGCLQAQGMEVQKRDANTIRLLHDGSFASASRHETPAAARAFYKQLYSYVKVLTVVDGRYTIRYFPDETAGPIADAVAKCGLP